MSSRLPLIRLKHLICNEFAPKIHRFVLSDFIESYGKYLPFSLNRSIPANLLFRNVDLKNC
jgi:hypothetical protein